MAEDKTGQMIPASKALHAIGTLLQSDQVKNEIMAAIPPTMRTTLTAERAIRSAWQCILADPEQFVKCTPVSIGRAIAEAATHGLIVDGMSGQAYLARFGTECVFMPGYKGKIALATRGRDVESISANVVYENDEVAVFDLANNEISGHKPHYMVGAKESGRVLCYYATATFRSGRKQIAVVSYADIQKLKASIAARNHGKLSDAWMYSEDEMGKKTAVHRLGKYLDLDPNAKAAFMRDDLYYRDPERSPGLSAEMQVPEVVGSTRLDRLTDALETGSATPKPAAPEKKPEPAPEAPSPEAEEKRFRKITEIEWWVDVLGSEEGVDVLKAHFTAKTGRNAGKTVLLPDLLKWKSEAQLGWITGVLEKLRESHPERAAQAAAYVESKIKEAAEVPPTDE